jgi:hypothetical protein
MDLNLFRADIKDFRIFQDYHLLEFETIFVYLCLTNNQLLLIMSPIEKKIPGYEVYPDNDS